MSTQAHQAPNTSAESKPQLLSAKDVMERLAMIEAQKAADEAKARRAAEAEKKALIEKLQQPSGVSPDEALRRVATIVERAVSNGLTEVQVFRFPIDLCTDRGRAIIQAEPGWEKTLTGVPREMFEFWDRELRDRGYKIRFEVLEWPGGFPGDIGITLRWA